MDVQDLYDRVNMAFEVGAAAVERFGHLDATKDDGKYLSSPIHQHRARALLLKIQMKQIEVALRQSLPMEVERAEHSVNVDIDVPTDQGAATDLVAQFTADAERAFSEFIDRVSFEIALNEDIFAIATYDVLRHLDPTKDESWRLIAFIATNKRDYKFTVLDERLKEAARVLNLLEDFERQLPDDVKLLKIRDWMASAIKRIHDSAAEIRAKKPPTQTPYGMDYDKERVVAQATVKIWNFDSNYPNYQSWFPEDHVWFPFHLPGKAPRLRYQYAIPPTAVAQILFPGWRGVFLVVAMQSGTVLFFDHEKPQPARIVETRISPSAITYAPFGMMLHGSRSDRNSQSPAYSYFFLSPEYSSLAGQRITERNPTDAEVRQLQTVRSARKRECKLQELSRCSILIQERLLPHSETHPEFFTMEQVANIAGESGFYIRASHADYSVLQPAAFYRSGRLKPPENKNSDLVVGLNARNSRLSVYSNVTTHQQSFLVAPGATHIGVSDPGLIALAGNGHLHVYGK